MRIAGLVKTSTIDYPGELAAVVFVPGCNYDCFYCHNRGLLAQPPLLDEAEVMAFLKKRAGMLDGVVVSGGEPTCEAGLLDFVDRIKALGYKVKLDTNGSQPELVARLVAEGKLDYVAVDYKAPWRRYREICGDHAEPEKVKETALFLMEYGIPFEMRTTVIPQLTLTDLREMAEGLPPLPRFVLKPYRIPESYRSEDRFRIEARPHSPLEIKAMAEAVSELQPNVEVME